MAKDLYFSKLKSVTVKRCRDWLPSQIRTKSGPLYLPPYV